MLVTEFFKIYTNYSSYDNLRKIASLVDGQKNAARKILYTVLEKNIKEKIKVSQLNSKMAEYAEYLHGNADNVIVNLAQDYVGTNNLPLLQKKGNFGTRFAQDAAASRYIYTYGTKEFFDLFKKEDTNVLIKQYFEGQEIEPVFYVPNLPILLINGSEGVSSGFAQKILPRNIDNIKKYIQGYLKNKKSKVILNPHYNNFNGIIEQGENNNQWLIKGIINRKGANKLEILEVPIGYDLKSYLDVLDNLEENGIIQNYKDKSENDNFKFEITIQSKYLKEYDDETLLTKLKLIKKVSENYTVMDENNKIKVFDNIYDILNHYIEVKLLYTQKRKEYLLGQLKEDISYDESKYIFIENVVNNKLIINKRKKEDIVRDIEKINKIIKKDDNYDYLLNMNILSLTEERMYKLSQDIENKYREFNELKLKTIQDIWLDEMKGII